MASEGSADRELADITVQSIVRSYLPNDEAGCGTVCVNSSSSIGPHPRHWGIVILTE